jgi:hypothetical protein
MSLSFCPPTSRAPSQLPTALRSGGAEADGAGDCASAAEAHKSTINNENRAADFFIVIFSC